jgi:hypothetical protein
MKLRPLPTVVERRFSKREKAVGAHSDQEGCRPSKRPGTIKVDPRQSPRDYCDTLIHESIHEVCPYLEEWVVLELADVIERVIHRAGYHRVYAPRKKMK